MQCKQRRKCVQCGNINTPFSGRWQSSQLLRTTYVLWCRWLRFWGSQSVLWDPPENERRTFASSWRSWENKPHLTVSWVFPRLLPSPVRGSSVGPSGLNWSEMGNEPEDKGIEEAAVWTHSYSDKKSFPQQVFKRKKKKQVNWESFSSLLSLLVLPFRGRHSKSSNSFSCYPLHPLRSHHLTSCPSINLGFGLSLSLLPRGFQPTDTSAHVQTISAWPLWCSHC